MNIDITQRPGIYLIKVSESQACDAVLRLKFGEFSCAPIILRGKKMRSEAAALNEIGASLQFPYYFGASWNSVDECLNDPNWMPLSDCVIVVSSFLECFVEESCVVDIRNILSELWKERSMIGNLG